MPRAVKRRLWFEHDELQCTIDKITSKVDLTQRAACMASSVDGSNSVKYFPVRTPEGTLPFALKWTETASNAYCNYEALMF
jgi:hypothetical protein